MWETELRYIIGTAAISEICEHKLIILLQNNNVT